MSKLVYSHPNSRFKRYKFVVGGKTFSGSTKCSVHSEAYRIAKKIKEEALERFAVEKHLSAGSVASPKDMSLDVAVEAFLNEYFEAEGLKGQKETERRFGVLLDRIDPETLITTVDDEVVRNYRNLRKKELTRKGLAPSNTTINNELGELQRLINWAHSKKKIKTSIIDWRGIKLKKAEQRERVVSEDEERFILERAPDDYGAMLRFALATGLRRMNLCVRWGDVDWINRTIKVQQKGGKTHRVTIDDELLEILQAQRGHHPEAVFTFVARRSKTDRLTGQVYERGKRYPITYWGLGSWFRRFMTKLGIENLTIHDLRRSFGSTMLLANDMAHASKALGHSSIKVTEAHYAFIPDTATRVAAEKAAVLRAARRQPLRR